MLLTFHTILYYNNKNTQHNTQILTIGIVSGDYMKILYSNMLPLGIQDNQETIDESIRQQIAKADRVEIAVGYVSLASLEELDRLVTENKIKQIVLVIGMYYIEGMPEKIYHTAVRINKRWQQMGIGEIRIVRSLKYHGKVYCFYKDDVPFSAVIGSANLGVIKLEANNRRQYELCSLTEDKEEAQELADIVERVKAPICSVNISEVSDMTLIREHNVSLTGIDTVEELPKTDIDIYRQHKTDVSFTLPLKVPAFAERFMDDKKHYTQSNINVCYSLDTRNPKRPKSRNWYEFQITVSKDIYSLPGYPEYKVPFFIVTDDGFKFKAHTTSQNNKQLNAIGDEHILGFWLKGRIAAAGLVTAVPDTQKDKDRLGMITKEMLEAYGCDSLTFTKTDRKALDEDGNELDVWLVEFISANNEE